MKIVSGSSNVDLAEKVAKQLGLSLTPLEIFIFPDGERRIRVFEDVIEQDCIIIQPTNPDVDTNYIELFLIIDALKRNGAREITVIMPYMGYQRQDHQFRDGECVSLEVMIKAIESLGADKIITFDMHSIRIPDLFHIPIKHLSAIELFAQTIRKNGWENDDTILISPDMGGINRVKLLSAALDDMTYANVVKNRDLDTGKVVAADIDCASSTWKNKSFDGKRLILVDDMISSGHTIDEAGKLLKKLDAGEMHTFVTHAIFSSEAPKILQNSLMENIYVTDCVFVPKEKEFAKLKIVSIARKVAEEVKN